MGYSPFLDTLSDALNLVGMVLPYTLAVGVIAVFAHRRFVQPILGASSPLLEVLGAVAATVFGFCLLPEVRDAGPFWGFVYLAPLPIFGSGFLTMSRALGRWRPLAGAVSALVIAIAGAAFVFSLQERTGDWVVLWLLIVIDVEVTSLVVVPLALLGAWYVRSALARRHPRG
ncbi:MAG: hypothetical protein ACYCX5_11395 [Coriobacteriia bacterium]